MTLAVRALDLSATMTETDDRGRFTRRALVAGVAGVAATAALSGGPDARPGPEPPSSEKGARSVADRMPVVYLPHGGGPWPFVPMRFGEPAELEQLADYLRSVATVPRARPKALLVVSAHWEEAVPTVMASPRPPMLYDYYGFPEEAYSIQWPAPGAPEVATRVRALLEAAGIPSATDAARGFDHGTFVPLKLTYPDADVPTLQLSLKRGLDPAEHLAIGRALAPLRDEGIFIVGSGMTFHNLRAFNRRSAPIAERFDAWLREAATLEPEARDRQLVAWAEAPAARQAHPREEHLLPLMVIAGAAGADRGTMAYSGTILGLRLSGYHYG
jgi:aromatic ring-opening dioxygenase catalytic subunit (LigB family)